MDLPRGKGGAARPRAPLGWKRLDRDEGWARPAVEELERRLLRDAVFPELAGPGGRALAHLTVIDPSARPSEPRHMEALRRIVAAARRLDVPLAVVAHREAGEALAGAGGRLPIAAEDGVHDWAEMDDAALAPALARLGENLSFLLAGTGSAPDRHVLVPFTDAILFALLVDRLAGLPARERPFVHLVLPWDEERLPNADRVGEPARLVKAARALNREAPRLFLYAPSRPLARRLSRRLATTVEPLELPPPPELAATPPPPPAAFTVAVPGAPRVEKGFCLLPEIVAAHDAASANPRGTRFLVQHHRARVPGEEWIRLEAAAASLRARPGGHVSLLEAPLSSEAWYRLLLQVDALLLPYDAAAYRDRPSALFADARAAGRLVFTLEGNFRADPGGARIVRAADAASLGAAIADAAAVADRHRADAELARALFWGRAEPARFFARLLLGPGAAAGRPVPDG